MLGANRKIMLVLPLLIKIDSILAHWIPPLILGSRLYFLRGKKNPFNETFLFSVHSCSIFLFSCSIQFSLWKKENKPIWQISRRRILVASLLQTQIWMKWGCICLNLCFNRNTFNEVLICTILIKEWQTPFSLFSLWESFLFFRNNQQESDDNTSHRGYVLISVIVWLEYTKLRPIYTQKSNLSILVAMNSFLRSKDKL